MNAIKEVFQITNKNISLATPLILYSLFSSIYLAVSAYGRIINLFIAVLLFMLMTVAFIAGWFAMIKQIIIYPDKDEISALFKTFTEGVGEYFIPVLGVSFVFLVIYTILMTIAMYFGIHFIGNPGIDSTALSNSLKSSAELKIFLTGLSAEQLSKLGMWNILILSTTSTVSFLLMLYFPALFFKSKNPIKALGVSFVNLFSKKFFNTLAVYLLIYCLYIITSIASALCSVNIVLHLLTTLINFYFIVLVCVGIFYYYYHNFIEEQKGKNIDIRI